MPLVLYEHPSSQTRKTARMFTPKRIQIEGHWLKEARKVLPAIPNPDKTDWRIIETAIDVKFVRFRLANGIGDTATVTIDRTVPGLG